MIQPFMRRWMKGIWEFFDKILLRNIEQVHFQHKFWSLLRSLYQEQIQNLLKVIDSNHDSFEANQESRWKTIQRIPNIVLIDSL